MEKTNKKNSLSQKKSVQQNESGSNTYIDSLYNSSFYTKEKENININNYKNVITEIYLPKTNKTKYALANNNQKEKNFYLALKTLNFENSQNNNKNNISKNLLSRISEFSEMNPELSKDYNVSKYIHHPIVKQIMKLGNQIIKKHDGNEYKVYNGLEINKPLVSFYNMKNVFEQFDFSYIGVENSSTNSKKNQKETINVNDILLKKRKKLKYFHRKNRSSITNYYFNENNSTKTMNNNDKRKKSFFHFRDNISSLIGRQNKIIFKELDSATTITKDDYNKDFHELNDLNINIFNNNKNLEVINDFDETKENKVYSTNKKSEELNIANSNNKGMNIKYIFGKKENNIKTFNKKDNLSMNKTLRKKYERTDFAFRNLNTKNNNLIMKNLMNKFEQCYKNEKSESLESNICQSIEENSYNKNNETFIVNEGENNFKLNFEVSENGNSFLKNNNIQLSEISSNKFSDKISNYSIKNELKLSSIKSKEENINSKSINSYPIANNSRKNINLYLNKSKMYETPDDSQIKKHHFDLSSPFQDENVNNICKTQTNISKDFKINNDNNNEDIPLSVFDYTFYQKLLKSDDIMSKKCKIISKKKLILNTELRLEILIWMMKTCEEFAFKRDTYHNACYYFDMYLSLTSLKYQEKKENLNLKDKSYLELIGLTCIVISAKLEEIQLPRLKEYAELLNKKYDSNSIIEMEKKICSELRWKLIVITKNVWLSWYICQWDLFIDTVDNIKEEISQLINENDILYYKKPNDNSYYNFRKISQLIDIMALDFNSYFYDQRLLIAISFFIILCNKYNLRYNFTKKTFENNSHPKLNNLMLDIYTKFILQSFDYNFDEDILQKGIKYFYNNYNNFNFVFGLPLFYQVHPDKLDGDSYEDFLSYQTTNDNYFRIIKEKININKNKSVKRIDKKINYKKKKEVRFENFV